VLAMTMPSDAGAVGRPRRCSLAAIGSRLSALQSKATTAS
jgi:hypothetical protein